MVNKAVFAYDSIAKKPGRLEVVANPSYAQWLPEGHGNPFYAHWIPFCGLFDDENITACSVEDALKARVPFFYPIELKSAWYMNMPGAMGGAHRTLDPKLVAATKSGLAKILISLAHESLSFVHKWNGKNFYLLPSIVEFFTRAGIDPSAMVIISGGYSISLEHMLTKKDVASYDPAGIKVAPVDFFLFLHKHFSRYDRMGIRFGRESQGNSELPVVKFWRTDAGVGREPPTVAASAENVSATFRPKLYNCLNGASRTHRILMALAISSHPARNEGYFSLFNMIKSEAPLSNVVLRLCNAIGVSESQFRNAEAFTNFPADWTNVENDLDLHDLTVPQLYSDCYYAVVNETHFFQSPENDHLTPTIRYGSMPYLSLTDKAPFVTEKTLKAIRSENMFIIGGQPGTLKFLRKYGFETFNPMIDESYDEAADDEERFLLVWKAVQRMMDMSHKEALDSYLLCRSQTSTNREVLRECKTDFEEVIFAHTI